VFCRLKREQPSCSHVSGICFCGPIDAILLIFSAKLGQSRPNFGKVAHCLLIGGRSCPQPQGAGILSAAVPTVETVFKGVFRD